MMLIAIYHMILNCQTLILQENIFYCLLHQHFCRQIATNHSMLYYTFVHTFFVYYVLFSILILSITLNKYVTIIIYFNFKRNCTKITLYVLNINTISNCIFT